MDNRVQPEVKSSSRRRGILGPILLILLGLFILLNNLGLVSGYTWDRMWRLWPLLLVAIGLNSLYKREGVVGAVLWIGVGSVFLLSTLGIFPVNVWEIILRLWPILLIAMGMDIMIGRRSWWVSLIAALVILAILIGGVVLFGVTNTWTPGQSVQIDQSLGNNTRALVMLGPVMANLNVTGRELHSGLITGTVSNPPGIKVLHDFSTDGQRARFVLNTNGDVNSFYNGNHAWQWDLVVNDQVPLELQVNMGVGSGVLDMRHTRLGDLKVDQGLGGMTVLLPAQSGLKVKVSGGIGQTLIYLPRDVPVQLKIDNDLASLQLPQGMIKTGDDIYTAPGIDTTAPVIELQVVRGIGQVVIEWIAKD